MLFLFDEYMFFLFPKCVAGVPVSLWGWRVRSLDVAFMFATVRNRPRQVTMAVPMVSSAKEVALGGCTCRVASFRVAGVTLRDIQACFVTCRKSF